MPQYTVTITQVVTEADVNAAVAQASAILANQLTNAVGAPPTFTVSVNMPAEKVLPSPETPK